MGQILFPSRNVTNPNCVLGGMIFSFLMLTNLFLCPGCHTSVPPCVIGCQAHAVHFILLILSFLHFKSGFLWELFKPYLFYWSITGLKWVTIADNRSKCFLPGNILVFLLGSGDVLGRDLQLNEDQHLSYPGLFHITRIY